jgi:hypothetical protein
VGLKVFALSLSLFVFTGCATLTSGMWDRVKLETTPSGAKVTDESGVLLTTTPGYITIKRRETPKLTFSKDGFEDVNLQLSRKLNKKLSINLFWWLALGPVFADGGLAMDDVFGIVFVYGTGGLLIDRLTGAIWDHDKSIHLEMAKTESVAPNVFLENQ